MMKIKISPCFVCGHGSVNRIVGSSPHCVFNACPDHRDELVAHGRLVLRDFVLYTRDGQSIKWDSRIGTNDGWKE